MAALLGICKLIAYQMTQRAGILAFRDGKAYTHPYRSA